LRGHIKRLVYLGARSVAYVTLDGDIPLLVHLPNRPGSLEALPVQGPVKVIPLPGALMPLPI
jgi:hypothetical protein